MTSTTSTTISTTTGTIPPRAPVDVSELSALDPELHAALTSAAIGRAEDPYPLLGRLRRDYPVLRQFGAVSVYRYDDVAAVLRHPLVSTDDRNSATYRSLLAADKLSPPYLSQLDDQSFLRRDPPEHTRLRKLVAKGFTPARTAALRGFVSEFVHGVLDRALDTAAPQGRLDVVDELAWPLPIAVTCELLGIPAEDRPFVASWPRAQLCCSFEPGSLKAAFELERAGASETGAARQAEADRIQQQLSEYFALLIARRRRDPDDSLVTALLTACVDGQHLTDEQINATLRLLFVAGYENAVNLIGHGTLALLHHRDQWEALRADPSLAGAVVDEALRYDAPFQFTRRIALAQLDIGGYRIDAGQHIIAHIGAANRDPHRFTHPDRFDIHRPNNRHHLSFGAGIHACLGGPLAKLQAEITFTALTQRLHQPTLVDNPPRYRTDMFRSLRALPITAAVHPGTDTAATPG